MSFVHGKARFCVKSWYTSVYRTKTNPNFVVQSRLNIANRLKKSWISDFYVTYEILPIKKYASLWYNVWHISWDMSFVHGKARFCVKSWYTSVYRTKTNPNFVVQSRLNIANRLKKSWISDFYVTYEILPIKKYASLWYNVWHISWDMSFVHGKARFCVKSWYTSVYRTKTNPNFVVQSRLNIANRLKKSWISHFYVTYEILPIKKYASLWYNVWHISWDMSFVHGKARFCVKSWYTSVYRTKTNRNFVVQSRL